jgi:hypothetical protein
MSDAILDTRFQCDICESIAGTFPVTVPMPGLRVLYHVCSDDCEAEARQRGRNAWDEWNKLHAEELGDSSYER